VVSVTIVNHFVVLVTKLRGISDQTSWY